MIEFEGDCYAATEIEAVVIFPQSRSAWLGFWYPMEYCLTVNLKSGSEYKYFFEARQVAYEKRKELARKIEAELLLQTR